MKHPLHLVYAGLAVAACVAPLAQAQLRIEISGVGSNRIPIAVAGFADESVAPVQISAIIKADLARSGAFNVIDAGAITDPDNIDLSVYKAKGADALVVGTVARMADGRYNVRYKLLDTVKPGKLSKVDPSVKTLCRLI
jgi:TolB protein